MIRVFFNIYLASERDKIQKCIKLVKELRKLRDQPLGPQQLKKSKQQLIGQIAIGQSDVNMMLSLGKACFLYNKVDTFDEVKTKIERISAQEIHETAQFIFQEEDLSTLIFKKLMEFYLKK